MRAVAARFDAVQAVLIDGAEVPFEVLELEDRRAVLSIPRVAGLAYSDAIVEVLFDARVLRFGGAFMGQIADSGRPHDVPQPVLSGDAIDEALGDRVWIETSIAVESVLEARAEPAAFTPNGDGVNDGVEIAYDLVEVTRPVSVEVEIRDLAGRRVRLLHSGEEGIGSYRRSWGRPPRRRQPGAPRHLPLPRDDNRCLRRPLCRGRPPAGRLLSAGTPGASSPPACCWRYAPGAPRRVRSTATGSGSAPRGRWSSAPSERRSSPSTSTPR